MTYPTSPAAAYDYVTFQTGSPTTPLPANQVANDYANHKLSIDQLINFSKLIQRSDGNLQNGVVHPESLSSGVLALLSTGATFKGAWLTATAYVVNNIVAQNGFNYICIVAHTSGVFATDLAAGKWQLVDGGNARLADTQTFTGVNTFSAAVSFGATASFTGTATFNGAAVFASTASFAGVASYTAAINEAQGTNIASAATTDIGAATGNYVKVTGVVTITALGTVQAGTRRVVEFTGALLLTHNAASLILPGGANITTAAGDVATFMSEGSGNWRCVGYMKASGGALEQTVTTQSGAVATGTTILPYDDTIPQITEGTEFITLSITPKSATSKLIIEAVVLAANSVAPNAMTVALFQDATANALAAISFTTVAATAAETLKLRHVMTSGTTSATTFRIRIGGNSAGTTTFNGAGGTRLYGGVAASNITIREVL